MAVAAITVAAEKSVETAEAISKRAEAVRIRNLPVYDYEKVFWNSTYTVGLVGLGWLAVQLGKIIVSSVGVIEGVGKFFQDQPAFLLQSGFFNTVDYVEGKKKGETPSGFIGAYAIKQMQEAARKGDYTLYNEYKESMFTRWIEAYPDTEARPSLEQQYADWQTAQEQKVTVGVALTPIGILEGMDKFFNVYGSIVPIGAVMGHMGLEALRVNRLRRKEKSQV